MSNLKRTADKVAQSMIDDGIPPDEIGLLMSQRTRERLFGRVPTPTNELLAHVAEGAAFMPNLGMMAAGPLLEFLKGMPKMELSAALKLALGVDDGEAHALAADVAAGGMVVVGSVGRAEGTAPGDAEITATQSVTASGVVSVATAHANIDDDANDIKVDDEVDDDDDDDTSDGSDDESPRLAGSAG